MRGLYAIVDADFLLRAGVEPLAFAEQVLTAKPAALQLRAKSLAPRQALVLLRALRLACTAAGTPLFANDRPDLAALAGADGVHVGQEDLAPADIRSLGLSLKIGFSTHSLEELAAALATPVDYIAYGPIFETSSKSDAQRSVGLAGLARAREAMHAATVPKPLVAIGGISLANIEEVARLADVAAVISGLWPAGARLNDVARIALEFQQAWLSGARAGGLDQLS